MLVGYGNSDEDEADDAPREEGAAEPGVPQSMFGALPTPLSHERELELEKERKKKKKEKKKAKLKALQEEEAKRLKAIEEKKKENPHGVLMRKDNLNVAPDLPAAHDKVTTALTTKPAAAAPSALVPAAKKAPEVAGRLVLLDQRRRGFAATGDAAMGSFSLDTEALQPSAPEETIIQYKIEPTPYVNATTAGRPTLKGRYRTKQLPVGPRVEGPVDLDLGDDVEHVAKPTVCGPGYPSDKREQISETAEPEEETRELDIVQDPQMKRILGKYAQFDPAMLVDVNAEDLQRRSRAEQMEADFEQKNATPVVDVKASFWNSKVGDTVTHTKGTKLHKRKHQINTLAAESAAREHELNKWRATGKAHLAAAKSRYGW